jgi:hypothetical protein
MRHSVALLTLIRAWISEIPIRRSRAEIAEGAFICAPDLLRLTVATNRAQQNSGAVNHELV